ncbi:MAG: ketopantoate reductase family protein [Rhizobiaceae bacterium]
MAREILILGASYGSLLSTKLLMAGHNVTLVCLPEEAELINGEGTFVRITLRGEDEPRIIASAHQPGQVRACVPGDADPQDYDLIAMAMQEPQYGADSVRDLLARIAKSQKPCLSIMNMPPVPYLRRIAGLDTDLLASCFTDPSVWDGFNPDVFSLCSPDPQAYRPPEEKLNFLHVGLPTNFKAAAFADEGNTQILRELEADIAAVRLDGKDVPVKLRVHDSLFVPLAKWSMLLTGNYRAITADGPRSIRDAVHSNLDLSKEIYHWVDALARDIGADPADQVPFEKYANAALGLLNPSSAARAVFAGAKNIERVDKLVQLIAKQHGKSLKAVDDNVIIVDAKLEENRAG